MLLKKVLAVLLVLLITVVLFGCASKSDVLGNYEAQLDITEIFNSRYTDTADIENYSLSELTLTQYLTVNEDGTYSYFVAEEEVERLLSKAEALTKDALEQYYARIIADTGVDTDVEEYLASVGTDLDAVAGEMKVGEEIEAIVERLNGEGHFTAEKKSIFAKEIIGSFNSFSGFEDYEFKDDTLKVNSRFLQKEIFYKKQ